MALFTIDEVITPVSREDVQAAIYKVLAKLKVRTTSWGEGSPLRQTIVGVSAVLASLSNLQAAIARSGFLDLAEEEWLTLVARYVYGVERISATFATGTVTLFNAGGGVFFADAGDLTVANPFTGKTFRNLAAFTLGANTTLEVDVIAVESGAASSSASYTLTSLVNGWLLVGVSNADALYALDEEKDAALRIRCREKLGSLSPFGPWDAYSYAARNATLSGGGPAGVTRVRIAKDGYGNVTVTAAGASGAIVGTLGDLTTPLGAVDDAVQRKAAPLSVAAHTESAVAKAVQVSYELWAYNTSGRTDDEIKALVTASLQDFFSTLPIGGAALTLGGAGYVFLDALRAAIAKALPEIYHVALALPAADDALTATEVAVLAHDESTQAVINQVAPPEGANV